MDSFLRLGNLLWYFFSELYYAVLLVFLIGILSVSYAWVLLSFCFMGSSITFLDSLGGLFLSIYCISNTDSRFSVGCGELLLSNGLSLAFRLMGTIGL